MALATGLVYGPVILYTNTGTVGASSEPDVDFTTSELTNAGWKVMGTNGAISYTDAGVVISKTQTINLISSVGTTAPIDAVRSDEGFSVTAVLQDTSIAVRALVANNRPVTTTNAASGVPGSQSYPGLRGVDVHTFQLLIRGKDAPLANGNQWNLQIWVPQAYVNEDGDNNFQKASPVETSVEFMALYDTTYGLYTYRVQTAAAL